MIPKYQNTDNIENPKYRYTDPARKMLTPTAAWPTSSLGMVGARDVFRGGPGRVRTPKLTVSWENSITSG